MDKTPAPSSFWIITFAILGFMAFMYVGAQIAMLGVLPPDLTSMNDGILGNDRGILRPTATIGGMVGVLTYFYGVRKPWYHYLIICALYALVVTSADLYMRINSETRFPFEEGAIRNAALVTFFEYFVASLAGAIVETIGVYIKR